MSDFEVFALDHPWALDLARSDILVRMLIFLSSWRTGAEVLEAFSYVPPQDVERALMDFVALGIVEERDGEYKTTLLGEKFLKAYRTLSES